MELRDDIQTLREAQDKRRLALIERLGTVADLACQNPLPGELGDVAYDLLRQAAAQISSDRLHLNRIHATPAPDREKLREALDAAVGLWAFRCTDEPQRVWLEMTRTALGASA